MHTATHVNTFIISLQQPKQSRVCNASRQPAAAAVTGSAAVASTAILRCPVPLVNTNTRHRRNCRAVKDDLRADNTKQQLPRARQAGTHSLQLSQASAIKAPLQRQQIADFRFWHDEKRFRGSGDVSLAQHVLLAAGGTRMGGNFKEAQAQGPMGWQVHDRWDVLWSTSDGALKAAPFIRQGQLISTMPGTDCLTKKRNLAVTLTYIYGEAAWEMLPRTYSIPSQLQLFRQRIRDEAVAMETAAAAAMSRPAAAAAIGPVTGYYVLKTGEHLGQGLKIVPSSKALLALLERNKPYLKPPGKPQNHSSAEGGSSSSSNSDDESSSMDDDSNSASSSSSRISSHFTSSSSRESSVNSSSGSSRATVRADGLQQQQQAAAAGSTPLKSAPAQAQPPRPFICVQQYITNPLLIQGRKFGLRLWVLVLGPNPFRAYLYEEGLVLFSTEQYNADLDAVVTQGADSQGHLTNAAQNQSAAVWPLSKLLSALGPAAAEKLQQQLAATAGKVIAAAAPAVQAAAQELNLPEGTCAFELLGLDFVLDSALHPWLLEVNASPSLAWDHQQPDTATLIRTVKTEMLIDMVALLRLQDRFPPGKTTVTQQQQQQQQQMQETGTGSASLHSCRQEGQHQQQQSKQEGAYNNLMKPLLLQAASARYFAARPEVLQLVMENAHKLQAAVAAAACRTNVQQQVPQQHQQGQLQSGNTRSHSSSHACSLVIDDQAVTDAERALEAEKQSAAGWQALELCMM